jgi:hypothetical protein
MATCMLVLMASATCVNAILIVFRFGLDCKDVSGKKLLATGIFHRFHACPRQYNIYCQSIIASIVQCRYTFGLDTNVYSFFWAGGHSFMKSTRNRAHLPPKIPKRKPPHCSYPACRGTSTDLSIYRSRFGLLVYTSTKLNPVCLLDLQTYGYRACTALTQDNI